MKVLIQRCRSASVTVDGEMVGSIGSGLMLLIGFGQGDTEACLRPMAAKIANLRIFTNEKGRFDTSLLDTNGSVLAVSQFTLYADTQKGRRPEFSKALAPEEARRLYEIFVEELRQTGVQQIATGVFGAYMQVTLENDGPVTLMLESSPVEQPTQSIALHGEQPC